GCQGVTATGYRESIAFGDCTGDHLSTFREGIEFKDTTGAVPEDGLGILDDVRHARCGFRAVVDNLFVGLNFVGFFHLSHRTVMPLFKTFFSHPHVTSKNNISGSTQYLSLRNHIYL